MATATFDKTFVITKQSSQNKLRKIMEAKPAPIVVNPFSDTERKKSAELLQQCLSHYERI